MVLATFPQFRVSWSHISLYEITGIKIAVEFVLPSEMKIGLDEHLIYNCPQTEAVRVCQVLAKPVTIA